MSCSAYAIYGIRLHEDDVFYKQTQKTCNCINSGEGKFCQECGKKLYEEVTINKLGDETRIIIDEKNLYLSVHKWYGWDKKDNTVIFGVSVSSSEFLSTANILTIKSKILTFLKSKNLESLFKEENLGVRGYLSC